MKLIVLCLFTSVLYTCVLNAQPWSDKQKEVLKDVDAYIASALKNDIPNEMIYFHASFRKWQLDESKPTNRDWLELTLRHADEEDQIRTIAFDSHPIDIMINDSAAVLFLKWSITQQNEKGKDSTRSRFLTATMIETRGKWLFTSWSEK